MAQKGMAYCGEQIFMINAPSEEEYLQKLCAPLIADDVWSTSTGIGPGASRDVEIGRAISGCSVVVSLVSPDFLASDRLTQRALTAANLGKAALAVYVRDVCTDDLERTIGVQPADMLPMGAKRSLQSFGSAARDKQIVDIVRAIEKARDGAVNEQQLPKQQQGETTRKIWTPGGFFGQTKNANTLLHDGIEQPPTQREQQLIHDREQLARERHTFQEEVKRTRQELADRELWIAEKEQQLARRELELDRAELRLSMERKEFAEHVDRQNRALDVRTAMVASREAALEKGNVRES